MLKREVQFLLILIIFIPTLVWAQKAVSITLPSVFDDSYQESELEFSQLSKNIQNQINKPGKLWIVFSDRADNPTYAEANSNSKIKNQLEMGEFVSVFEAVLINEEWFLHVFKRDLTKGNSVNGSGMPTLASGESDLGWISFDKIIPSVYCLKSSNGISRKAMIARDFNPKDDEPIPADFFDSPFKGKIVRKSSDIDIFFIHKISGNMVFLSKYFESPFSKRDAEKVPGWLHNKNIIKWDTRFVIENQYGPGILEMYAMNKKIFIFPSQESLSTYKKDQSTLIPNEDQIAFPRITELDKDRSPTRTMATRYPVIKTNNNNTQADYTVSVIGGASDIDQTLKDGNKVKNNIKNLNLIFIIDKTNSMGPYQERMVQAIERSITNFMGQGIRDLKFHLTCIGYFNKIDEPKTVIETEFDVNFDNFRQKLPAFCNRIRATKCVSNEKVILEEYVYDGIFEGLTSLKKARPDIKKESNFIIWIGDCGNLNIEGGKTQKDVVNIMNDLDASFVGFQVKNSLAPAYEMFTEDLSTIVHKLAERSANNFESEGITTDFMDIPNIKKSNSTCVQSRYNKNNIPLIDKEVKKLKITRYYSPTPSIERQIEEMDENLLSASIVEVLDDVVDKVRENVTVFSDDNRINRRYFELEFKKENPNLSDAEIKRKAKNLYGSYRVNGYITDKNKITKTSFGEDEVVFEAILMDDDELKDFENALKDLTSRQDDQSVDNYALVQNVLVSYAKRITGEQSRDVILNKSLDEIWGVVFGTDCPYEILGKKVGTEPLKEFNREVFAKNHTIELVDASMDQFIETLTKKSDRFKAKKSTLIRYQYGSYYVIPKEYLP